MTPGPGLQKTILPLGFLAGGINSGVRRYRPDLGIIFSELYPNHFFGAITFFDSLNHAPHQLKELFATILCLHKLISLKSS